ncbi:MAG: DUF3575 domain-containing protein, partial [Bacteroidales bacterium]|nr:DUF3575 domain-containing protein [Bacteroidales bacterium]
LMNYSLISKTMKKIVIVGLSMLIMSSVLYAQDAQKMNAVKTDLFSAFLRTGVIKYERAINEDMSFQLGFFYTGYSPRESESTLNGFGITPEFRYYLSDTPAPSGTYLAPNFRYMKLTATDPLADAEASLTSFGFAINLGKQVVLKDIILIDAWVGPAYNFRTLDDPSGEVDTGISGVDGFGIRLGIAIGIAF